MHRSPARFEPPSLSRSDSALRRFAWTRRLAKAGLGCAALLSVCAASTTSHADQFVLFDITYTYTWDDAISSTPSQSHYYLREDNGLNSERPDDWTSPIDYRNGSVHIRAEIMEKPEGGQPATWTLCYIPNEGQGNGYGCTGTGTYAEEGVYESDVSMTDWWENESIIWSEGVREMHLVMKDGSGGSGHIHFRPDDQALFVPTTLRLSMVQVSAGDSYDPSILGLSDPEPVDPMAPSDEGLGGSGPMETMDPVTPAPMAPMAPAPAPTPPPTPTAEMMPEAPPLAPAPAPLTSANEAGGCALSAGSGRNRSDSENAAFFLGFGLLGLGLLGRRAATRVRRF
jgi:hypothetical protein